MRTPRGEVARRKVVPDTTCLQGRPIISYPAKATTLAGCMRRLLCSPHTRSGFIPARGFLTPYQALMVGTALPIAHRCRRRAIILYRSILGRVHWPVIPCPPFQDLAARLRSSAMRPRTPARPIFRRVQRMDGRHMESFPAQDHCFHATWLRRRARTQAHSRHPQFAAPALISGDGHFLAR